MLFEHGWKKDAQVKIDHLTQFEGTKSKKKNVNESAT